MNVGSNEPRVIVALDFANEHAALTLLDQLDPAQCRAKIGKQLFTAAGPDLVRRVVARGFDVFLDLKFHDIPTTVAHACRAAAELGVWMLNVHAMGGAAMLAAAREALNIGPKAPKLIAVTVLTSMGKAQLKHLGIALSIDALVARLASDAAAAGLDGVVCSALEASTLRAQRGPGFLLVTPGIRPAGTTTDDQQRILAPEQALAAGADYLVIGRPITAAKDPQAALAAINDSLFNKDTA